MPEERLFIKVILPKQGVEQRVPAGGSPPRPLKVVTAHFRNTLAVRLGEVERALDIAPSQSKVVPLTVTLEDKALAKSHRPTELFNSRTCPVIGAGKPGQLYVKGTPNGVAALKRLIKEGDSPKLEKAISTVRSIRAVGPADRLFGLEAEDVFRVAPKAARRARVKVSLFDYLNPREQRPKSEHFERLLQEHSLAFAKHDQFTGQEVYSVECRTPADVELLAKAVMVRSISPLPVFRSLRDMHFNPRAMPSTLQQLGADPTDFPVVAVVDSGVTAQNQLLQQWVYRRERFVAAQEENTYHGSFVAGLLVWGHELNPTHSEVQAHPCRILDVHVLPNSDPTHGDVGFIAEPELLQDLEECLKKYANDVKVWNLSLGSDEVCQLDRFSDFAVQLDELQERYGVSFVIAAGNYQNPPLLSFPRTDVMAERGRITTPADSVLGITVGAICHVDHPSAGGAQRGEPAPFSRNGPGPNHIIKPDLTHFGGNVGMDLANPIGLTSISGGNTVAEDIGTSFSTPLVSRQLAYVYHRVTPTPSPMLARALITHCARDLRTAGRIAEGEDRYFGFGMPVGIDQALECTPWLTTLVFQETLRPGYFLEWDNFPYPESLTDGDRYRGEIWMTLAYPPKRNPNWGSEYCETHVDAHFGITVDGKLGPEFHGQVPPEHSNPGQLWETFQVRVLRKWAPVRTFYRMIPRGITGKKWRLVVRLLSRHDVEQANLNQPFALILTIADPDRRAPVYDEMAAMLRARFQTQNLILRPTVRVQTKAS